MTDKSDLAIDQLLALRTSAGRLQERFSPGYGYTAIIIAWLAKLNPIAIIPVAYLFGGLLVGGDAIQPAGIADLLQAAAPPAR